MYTLMFKQFLRTPSCKLGLVLVMFLGMISILIGKQFLNEQKKEETQVAKKQLRHIERNVEYHSDDIGLLLYYLKFAVVNQTNPLTGLAIGQKDVNPNVLSLKILTLEGQKHETDLVNPYQLLFGNLDLSFIILYVFPLLIIAFSYNLRSEEEETGTWRLVSVLAKSKIWFLLKKLSVKIILLFAALSILFIIAGLVMKIPFDVSFIIFIFTSFLYLLFWFVLCFLIISLKQNSNFNALTLLSLWLVLVMLLPAALNNWVTNQYPVPEAYTTFIQQRDGYHQKWDTNKRKTVEKFYASYPQFESYGYPAEEGFNWLWYYAMQNLGDEESHEQSNLMHTKILQRVYTSRIFAKFIPTLHTQLAFNDIAGSSLVNHLSFLDYTDSFHEQTRLYFYPKIFANEDAREVDWSKFQPAQFQLENQVDGLAILIPLIITILILLVLSFVIFRKNTNLF